MAFKCKLTILFVFAFILNDSVLCAMKKSWKSANFDADPSAFTTFNQNQDSVKIESSDKVKEVLSAEEFITPYRSKVRSAAIAKTSGIYDPQMNEFQKNSKDFGSFDVTYENNGQEIIDKGDEPEKSVENHEKVSSLEVSKVLKGITGGSLLDVESIYKTIKDDSSDEKDNDGIDAIKANDRNITLYNLGPLMNLTVNSDDNLVNVNLDKILLKDIITGL